MKNTKISLFLSFTSKRIMFGELLDMVMEIKSKLILNFLNFTLINKISGKCQFNFKEFQCESNINHPVPDHAHNLSVVSNANNGPCRHNLSSLFLLIGMAFYTVACNLLILNMIIATFT